jgi:hypothetical protein
MTALDALEDDFVKSLHTDLDFGDPELTKQPTSASSIQSGLVSTLILTMRL